MPAGYERVMRTFRVRCKLYTQAGVASRAGVSVQTVCDVENERRAPWGKLLAWLGYEMRYSRAKLPASPDVTTATNLGDTPSPSADHA